MADDVKVTVRLNGPYRIEGPITLVDQEGGQFALPEDNSSHCAAVGGRTTSLSATALTAATSRRSTHPPRPARFLGLPRRPWSSYGSCGLRLTVSRQAGSLPRRWVCPLPSTGRELPSSCRRCAWCALQPVPRCMGPSISVATLMMPPALMR